MLFLLTLSTEYHVCRQPALNELGEPLWPEQWPTDRLAQRRSEIGEIEFSRQMQLEGEKS